MDNETKKKVVSFAYGCQMSERDNETLTELSVQAGYERANDLNEADLVIVNTCCVRESAENKILGKIGELKNLKKSRPHLKIAVTGCMVQQPGALERLQKRAPHVDIWAGTFSIHDFKNLLKESEKVGKISEVLEAPKSMDEMEAVPLAERGKLRANVNIMYGCNNFCTYCIVPHVRGRERSRTPEDIIKEITELVQYGCREVTLLGQNVNSYGAEFTDAFDFSDLLAAVDQIPGLERVRFVTSHPKDLSEKLIATIAQGTHLCEHFHLPIQAGSNHILQRMNRKYSRETYLEVVNKILTQIPHASLSTDIIVGFPGETEEDFTQTLDIMQQVHYSQAFTFMYSKRSGTPAATMDEQVPLDVKKRRLQELLAVQNQRSLEWRQSMVGQTYEVLVEGPSKGNPDRLAGRTRTNELIVFPGDISLTSQLIDVKVVEAGSWTLFGEIA